MPVKQTYRVRSYISYSQLKAFESKDHNQYIKKYLQGIEFENKYTRFGKKLHEALLQPTKDKAIEQIKLFLPEYKKREITIQVTEAGIPLLGILDGLNPRQKTFCDWKTGKKYSQSTTDKNDQLTFYWLLLWKKYGWLPKRAFIHHIETAEINGDIYATGNIQTFETHRTMSDMLLMFGRIKRAYKGIEILCNEHLKDLIK